MLGRFFFIGLLLIGTAAVALFATRTGFNVGKTDDGSGVVCTYWLGIGMTETRFGIDNPAHRTNFECPILLRDVTL